MPSRILHLAVTSRLADALPFRDPLRLAAGSVLPDAELLSGDPPVKAAHYPKLLCGGARKTLDLSGFRARFRDRLLTDDLVLGYYLHLCGDVIHRQIFYNETGWNPTSRAAVRLLHRDYALLNPIVIPEYGIRPEKVIPPPETLEEIARDPLFSVNAFDIRGFYADMARDFDPPDVLPGEPDALPGEGDFTVFTPALAEEWIRRTAHALLPEVISLRGSGRSTLDEDAMSWERKK